jgi:starch synthase (maltosyl-transferring)
MIGRIAITAVHPVVDGGAYSARAAAGELVEISAQVFREGHDLVGATAILRGPGKDTRRTRLRLTEPGLDLFTGQLEIGDVGPWTLQVEGWGDPIATWLHGLEAKIDAGVDVSVESLDGVKLFERAAKSAPAAARPIFTRVIGILADDATDPYAKLAAVTDNEVAAALWAHPLREFVSASARTPILVDRPAATFCAWYEIFPRSYGGLRAAAQDLPRIGAMGFDVVYLPPVHPIGLAYRKGPNNSLDAGPQDPGSPWAIGSPDGGHDAIAPELGSVEDFAAFVDAAANNGLEVALDLALQCSPDHPWVTEHPEWFTIRADSSIAFAENPPKKYQDIYPLNFDNDPEGIRTEILRIVRLWVSRGIKIFRVDNPHTKPPAFWEWLIAQVKSTDPDVLFLAEAFTRPPMMHLLAKIGFTQSYTYFTWRNSAEELSEYLTDLTTSPTADYMRPNLWPNTPDILHAYLQHGGPPAFKIRAVLAATLSPAWGIYSGYELYEGTAVRPGTEEYLNSEKYQLRPRDFAGAAKRNQSLEPYLTRLNEIRREHLALQRLRGLTFHRSDNPNILVYSRRSGEDTVLCVISLDPYTAQESTVHLDLSALGIEPGARFVVHDQVGPGTSYAWGEANYVRLDPLWEPAHVFTVSAT